MNRLQEEIARLEADTDRDELNELLLYILYEKQEKLGEEPSEEEAEEAVNQARKELLTCLLGSNRTVEAEQWDENTVSCMEQVRSVFDGMELQYREYVQQPGVYAFELGINTDGRTLRVKVYLESEPKTCRIDAIYPFQAEPDFAYPLCAKLAQENYPRRYGALQYDPSDQELSYRYSFSIRHGLYEDDFGNVLAAVVSSANASYDAVKQYAIGRFRRPDREEIICKAQKLIVELEQ